MNENVKTETAKDITNDIANENTTNTNANTSSKTLADSPASLSASFIKDQDGFDDVDAYFNQAVTPQRTPTSKSNVPQKTPRTATKTTSKSGTPLKTTIARPVALISSKIAAHYQKEPRFAVSMSEVAMETGVEHEEPEKEEADDNNNIDAQQKVISFHNDYNSLSAPIADMDNMDDYIPTFESTNHDEDALVDRMVQDLLVTEPVSNGGEANKATTAANKKPRQKAQRKVAYYPSADFDSGKRQSKRQRMSPLRYWANEKVCYGRAEDPTITLPVIVNVIKKPELDDPTFMAGRTARRPRNPNAVKLRAQAFGPECDVEAAVRVEDAPPSDDSDYDEESAEEIRTLALSHHHVNGDEVKGHGGFRIHTMFTEGAFMSAGQLLFPPGSGKPAKNSARHALVFYVISGSFKVTIHRTCFVIGPGGQFHVPRNNAYSIAHVSTDKTVEGRLFFCHCKDNAQ